MIENRNENNVTTSPRVSASRFIGGYLWAVTGAVVCFVAGIEYGVIHDRVSHGTLFPMIDTLEIALSDLLFFPFFWLMAFALSILPCTLVLVVARQLNIRSAVFYILAGGVVGLCGDLILMGLLHNLHWYTDSPDAPELSKWQAFSNAARILFPTGAAGGLAFWLYAITRYRRANGVEPSQ